MGEASGTWRADPGYTQLWERGWGRNPWSVSRPEVFLHTREVPEEDTLEERDDQASQTQLCSFRETTQSETPVPCQAYFQVLVIKLQMLAVLCFWNMVTQGKKSLHSRNTWDCFVPNPWKTIKVSFIGMEPQQSGRKDQDRDLGVINERNLGVLKWALEVPYAAVCRSLKGERRGSLGA